MIFKPCNNLESLSDQPVELLDLFHFFRWEVFQPSLSLPIYSVNLTKLFFELGVFRRLCRPLDLLHDSASAMTILKSNEDFLLLMAGEKFSEAA